MSVENECVLNTAERVVSQWKDNPPDVSWEEDRNGNIVFSGKCPIDGHACKVVVNIKDGRIVGEPEIVVDDKECEAKNKAV